MSSKEFFWGVAVVIVAFIVWGFVQPMFSSLTTSLTGAKATT